MGTTGPGKGTGGSSVGTTLAGSGHSAAPKGSVTGDWTQGTDKRWKFSSGTQGYQNQWAYVYNPYADPEKGQNRRLVSIRPGGLYDDWMVYRHR